MQTYKEYQPTQFDRKGAFLQDQGDWLVTPVIQTRDSEALELSNFEVCLSQLGGESETVEVHRFGHWGPGWFEIIIVKPNTPQSKIAEDIESALSDYPVLDDEHFSELEYNQNTDYWASSPLQWKIDACKKAGLSILQARFDHMPETSNGEPITNYL